MSNRQQKRQAKLDKRKAQSDELKRLQVERQGFDAAMLRVQTMMSVMAEMLNAYQELEVAAKVNPTDIMIATALKKLDETREKIERETQNG